MCCSVYIHFFVVVVNKYKSIEHTLLLQFLFRLFYIKNTTSVVDSFQLYINYIQRSVF